MTALPLPERGTYIYVRISDDKDGREAGVQRQETECRALAARMGLTVTDVIADNDRSASEYASRTRDGYARLRAAVETGAAGTVIAWSGDRLHRRPDELESWLRLARTLDVSTVLVQGGALDTRSAMGRMAARQQGAMSAYESDVRSERVTAAMEQLAQQGRWRGTPAFGWDRIDVEKTPGRVVQRFTGTKHPVESLLVAEASTAVIRGESLSSIAKDWNERGVLTLKGNQWSPTQVKQVLSRAANAGLVEHHGDVLEDVTGQWEPLVSEETWRAVVRTLTDPSRKTTDVRNDRHLGSGVYRCGVCGGPMRSALGTSRGRRYAIYRCRDNDCVFRVAEPVDDLVTQVVLGVLEKPENRLSPPAADNGLHEERQRLRQKLEQVADDYADDKITAAQRDRITARLRQRLEEIERHLTPDERETLLGDITDPHEWWQSLSVPKRRAVVRLLADVVIEPVGRNRPKRFDPSSVTITPR